MSLAIFLKGILHIRLCVFGLYLIRDMNRDFFGGIYRHSRSPGS